LVRSGILTNKRTILVVEDEALIAANLVYSLSSLGYSVQKPVATGGDAIRAVKIQKPDLVLMDIELIGEMNGIETAEKIREITDIPIVYLTAYTDDLRLNQARLTEPYGYIIKPALSPELRATLEIALYKHDLNQKLKESEAKLQLVLSGSQTGMWELDLTSMKGVIDERAANILGFQQNDIGTDRTDWDELSHPDDVPLISKRLSDYIDGKTVIFESEHRMKNASGDWIWVIGRGKITSRLPDGTPLMISGTLHNITGRKQAEAALQVTQEKYTKAFLASPDAIMISDLETGNFVEVNDATSQIYGYSRDELIGKSSLELGIWLRNEDMEAFTNRVRTTGWVEQSEIEQRQKSGTLFNASISADTINIEGRVHILMVVRDITRSKIAEGALRESECKFRTIFDSTFGLMALLRLDGTVLGINKTALKFGGLSLQDVVRKPFWEISWWALSPEIQSRLKEAVGRAASGKIVRYEEDILGKDGEVITIDFSLKPVRGAPGTVTSLVAEGRDITERKQAEVALRESGETIRTLINSPVDSMLIIDPHGIICDLNTTFENRMGRDKGELIGTNVYDLLPPDLADLRRSYAAEVIRSGKPVRWEDQRDGVRLDQSIHPIFDAKGDVAKIAIIARDITERKKVEEALNQANRKLTLLSSITRHDIKNQILALNGFVELLHGNSHDPESEEYFSWIVQVSDRISSMIEFTKECGQVGAHAPSWQNPRILADTAAKEIPLGNITIFNHIPAGTEVFADPLIIKVFYNLMDNAVRYGGKITTIRFFTGQSGNDHLLICEDDGVGIPAEEKEKIFERGFGKNTGLGLFLAREILSITGITIRETGEPGKGARFEIRVPDGMWRLAGAAGNETDPVREKREMTG